MLSLLTGFRRRAGASRLRSHQTVLSSLAGLLCALNLFAAAPHTLAQGSVGIPFSGPSVLTQHNDNARTGVNPRETFLTPDRLTNGYVDPTTLQRQTFGKLFERTLDGDVFAQPLYVPNVPITDPFTGRVNLRNVVYVATVNNSIYAFDADKNTGAFLRPYWQLNFNFPLEQIGPVPSDDITPGYADIGPTIGIVGTPAIDLESQTLYVVVRTREGIAYKQRLYAVDITTGAVLPNSPIDIDASVEGNGDGSIEDPNNPGRIVVAFDPLMQNQQAGLLLNDGKLYIAWGSHADLPFFHGWVMAYDASTLQQLAAFCTTPDGSLDLTDPNSTPVGGGINQSGAGIAADSNGSVYVVAGNGVYTRDTDGDGILEGRDFGSSILKLNGSDLSVSDYFTPFNHQQLTSEDSNLSSGGVVLLPSSAGSAQHPNLLVTAGREGRIYLLDRTDTVADGPTRLGGFSIGSDNVAQSFRNAVGSIWGTPAYFNGKLYFAGSGDFLKAFNVTNGQIVTPNDSRSTVPVDFPGATPSISANGTQNGIVWTVNPLYNPGVLPGSAQPNPVGALYAHDATNVSRTLFSGIGLGAANVFSPYTPFTVPTVANGKVYVTGRRKLITYGMGKPQLAQATRFQISGPVYVPPFLFLPSVSEKIVYHYSITAIGADQRPIRLNSSVQLAARDGSGRLFSLGTVRFNNQSNVVVQHAFLSADLYELIVTDRLGATGSTFIFVKPAETEEQDRFQVIVKASARVGEVVPFTIRAVSNNGTPRHVWDISTNPAGFVPRQFFIYNTRPTGTQDLDDFSPGWVYDGMAPDGTRWLPDPAPQPELFDASQVTIMVPMHEVGTQIFVVTDFGGRFTGTAVVNVRP